MKKGFVPLEVTYETSPDAQGRGWRDVWPSTCECTPEGPLCHTPACPTHLSPQCHKNRDSSWTHHSQASVVAN